MASPRISSWRKYRISKETRVFFIQKALGALSSHSKSIPVPSGNSSRPINPLARVISLEATSTLKCLPSICIWRVLSSPGGDAQADRAKDRVSRIEQNNTVILLDMIKPVERWRNDIMEI